MCLRIKAQLLALTFRCEGILSPSLISFLVLLSLSLTLLHAPQAEFVFSFVLNILNLDRPWASVFLNPSIEVLLPQHGQLFF